MHELVWKPLTAHPGRGGMLAERRWDVQDAVARFGFADQAHLLRSFKKYHGMTPAAALALARAAEPVAFLQADEGENPVYWE